MSKKQQAAEVLVRLLVSAGKASPQPPVGPALGARGVKSMDFCKQFNDKTKHIITDTPVPTVITIKPDRTFTFVTKTPPTTFLLKRAAGIDKGASKPGTEIVGNVSLKHVYEIAKLKQQDTNLKHLSLESICGSIIGVAKSVGIQVVH
ncbi:50S ribosomal protein L11 [Halteromyces radiatus]|uniref:50S ribosomal protein L11 n=1 Tax=Halteromyces radiatus TaxID=101107 RepID=UPI00221E69AC|nr:50S ribosomal protein L11 [Halteromyces radiatus]KAI8092574.1 50S ribosomal protein L11 [Halteromyces radiatus]